MVTLQLSSEEPAQFALFVNGAPVASSVVGSGAGTQQLVGTCIVTLSAGDVLTVVNHTSAAEVLLQTVAGGTQTNANAQLTILKLQ
jgi:hypothetical protein